MDKAVYNVYSITAVAIISTDLSKFRRLLMTSSVMRDPYRHVLSDY